MNWLKIYYSVLKTTRNRDEAVAAVLFLKKISDEIEAESRNKKQTKVAS